MTKATFIRTTFNWGCITGSEVQSLIIKEGTWQHPGKHGVGEAESSTSLSKDQEEKTGFKAARMKVLKYPTTVAYFLQEGHTSK